MASEKWDVAQNGHGPDLDCPGMESFSENPPREKRKTTVPRLGPGFPPQSTVLNSRCDFGAVLIAHQHTRDAAVNCLNHLAFRVDDMDEFVSFLAEKGIEVEAGPFDLPLAFDRPLGEEDDDLFKVYGDGGLQLKIMFFRGPSGERFEVLEDDIAGL